jgi:hypothetical protein
MGWNHARIDVEGLVQGRSVLERLLLSLAGAVAIVLAFGTANALACEALAIDKTEAKAGETVNFTLSGCQLNDEWELAVFFEKNATPERRTLAGGIAEDTTITGEFALPDEIGDTEQEVTLKLFVVRDGQQLDPLELQMLYLPGGTPPSPTNKAQCKNGGYVRFGFKNQGQCVAFVQPASKP